jgi:hypothetical protein
MLAAQIEIERLSREGDLRPRTGTGIAGLPFHPVVEGRLLPRPPIDSVRAGVSSAVHVLVGTNRDEMTLFPLGEVNEERLRRITARLLPDADVALAAYRTDWPGASPEELLNAILTDRFFRIPAARLTALSPALECPGRSHAPADGTTDCRELAAMFLSSLCGRGSVRESDTLQQLALTVSSRGGYPDARSHHYIPSPDLSRRERNLDASGRWFIDLWHKFGDVYG